QRLIALHDRLRELRPRDLPQVDLLLDEAWPGRVPGSNRRVLFVCYGNQGRSPMAEQLFRDELKKAGENRVLTRSGGLGAYEGLRMDAEALLVLAERGINAMSHRSRPVEFEDAEKADLILTMEALHARFIARELPEAEGKTF